MNTTEPPGSPVLQTGPVTSVPPPQGNEGDKPKREGLGSIGSTLAVIIIAPLVALFLTAFIFQSYQVDGPSMQHTLFNNDRLLVWKVPKSWARLTHQHYIPQRGDIIIFVERGVSDFEQNPGKQLVKRVIGLPGERVVVKNNMVKVYSKQHPEGFLPDKTLPYGNVIKDTNGEVDVTVPAEKVFVMGDNRVDSLDSRFFGPVASDDIVGKLVARVWPLTDAKVF